MVDIVLEVLQQLAVVRKVGPIFRHRILLEPETEFGGVDVQRLIASRQTVGVLVVPVAADLVGQLELVVGDAQTLQAAGEGEAGATGPDYANFVSLSPGHAQAARGR